MNNRPLTYLACPYTLKQRTCAKLRPETASKVEDTRANEATKAASWLIQELGYNVFSPITHSHLLHRVGGLSGTWDFWKLIDTEYLSVSKRLVVLCIPGWEISTGVQEEINIARSMGIEILYLKKLPYGRYTINEKP